MIKQIRPFTTSFGQILFSTVFPCLLYNGTTYVGYVWRTLCTTSDACYFMNNTPRRRTRALFSIGCLNQHRFSVKVLLDLPVRRAVSLRRKRPKKERHFKHGSCSRQACCPLHLRACRLYVYIGCWSVPEKYWANHSSIETKGRSSALLCNSSTQVSVRAI